MAKTTITKSDFIRKYPDLTPMQVSEKAKEAGLDIKPNHVSAIRFTDKAKSGAPKGKVGRPRKNAAAAAAPAVAKKKPGRPPKAASAPSAGKSSEQALANAAWDVAIESGIHRALEIVRQVEGKLRGLKR